MTKVGIYIPCYNVENSIKELLLSFSPQVINAVDEILVVDNCSQDRTSEILEEIKASGAPVAGCLMIISNAVNRGLGGSQKIAFRYFIDRGFSHFMIIHGDNQADGQQVADLFLREFKADPGLDLIMASRFLRGSDTSGYDHLRVAGNLFFNMLTLILTGCRMSDAGAAIIFLRTDVLKNFPFQELTDSFQFNPQLNILMFESKRLKIKEVGITWRDSKDRSNIKAMNYSWTLLKILVKYFCFRVFWRRPGWQAFATHP